MQDRRPHQGVFVGRAAELAQVTDVIATVETGQPWLVAIEGDPGVGKTALAAVHALTLPPGQNNLIVV